MSKGLGSTARSSTGTRRTLINVYVVCWLVQSEEWGMIHTNGFVIKYGLASKRKDEVADEHGIIIVCCAA